MSAGCDHIGQDLDVCCTVGGLDWCEWCCVAVGRHGPLGVCVVCEDVHTDARVEGVAVCAKCEPPIRRFTKARSQS